jgi:hypothetical protein
MIYNIKKAAVLGAGVMGASIATHQGHRPLPGMRRRRLGDTHRKNPL